MSIQLLNFPYVVQRHILKQMSYGDLFFFSLTSKKSIKLIRSVSWGDVKRIEFSTNSQLVCVHILSGENDWTLPFKIWPQKKDDKLHKIHISGMDLNYKMPTEKQPHVFCYDDEGVDYEAVGVVVYNQLNAIFGSHVKYVLGERNYRKEHFLPKQIPFNQTDFMHWHDLQVNVLEEYFDAIPKQEYVNLNAPFLEGDFRHDSRIYDADTLYFLISKTNSRIALAHFRGKTACLSNAYCGDNHVIEFLKKWKTNEAFQILETFELQTTNIVFNSLNLENMKKHVEIKQLSHSIGPQIIKLTDKELFNESDITEISTSSYIVRNDGIVGIIAVNVHHFVFKVKTFTEEEMLKMEAIPVD